MEASFAKFNSNNDGLMTLVDFGAVCRNLFRNQQGEAYPIDEKRLQGMFDVFDVNEDGFLDLEEFSFCWKHWIQPIVKPVSALIVVDVQNDFIGGTLSISSCPAKQDGYEVVEPINEMVEAVPFDAVLYSLDWHPDNHISFVENVGLRKIHPSSKKSAEDAVTSDTVVFEGPPVSEQTLWPKHCVQNSWGAELHKDLKVPEKALFVQKGTNPDIDSYSAFWDNNKVSQTELSSLLVQNHVTDVYVCGLAYDICVGATANHALELGYRTIMVMDACRSISLDRFEIVQKKLMGKHAIEVDSSKVKDMVEGRDRNPELGYFLANHLRQIRKEECIEDPVVNDELISAIVMKDE